MTQVKFVSRLVQIHPSLISKGTYALTWHFFLLEFTPFHTGKVIIAQIYSSFSLFLCVPKYITLFLSLVF